MTQNVRFLIGDLGLCTCYKKEDESLRGKRGTPYFYAPEIWKENRFGIKADIWAMGALTIFLF